MRFLAAYSGLRTLMVVGSICESNCGSQLPCFHGLEAGSVHEGCHVLELCSKKETGLRFSSVGDFLVTHPGCHLFQRL